LQKDDSVFAAQAVQVQGQPRKRQHPDTFSPEPVAKKQAAALESKAAALKGATVAAV